MFSRDRAVGEDGDGERGVTDLLLTEWVSVKGDAGVELIAKFQTSVNWWWGLYRSGKYREGQQVWCGKDRSICFY